MKASLIKGAIAGVVVSAMTLFALNTQAQEPVYRVSTATNPKVTKAAFNSTDPIEDNKTYMAFDSRGAMYYFDFQDKSTYGYMVRQKGSDVQKIDLMPAIKQLLPKAVIPNDSLFHAFGSFQIDNQNHFYAIFYVFDPYGPGGKHWKARIPVLLYSLDNGQHFTATLLPGDPDQAFLEGRTYATSSEWPPLIGWSKATQEVVYPIFANRNIYGVILPRLEGGSLVVDQSITITEHSPGVSVHTGGQTFACTKGNTSYVAYNEIPDDKKGNNIWVATINRKEGRLEDKKMLVNLPKPTYPDIHITPLIVVSKTGILNLITDGDGDAFIHFVADANRHEHLDWKQMAKIPGSNIYSDLVIDGSDHLHLLFTEWSTAPRVFYTNFDPSTSQWSKPVNILATPAEFPSKTKDNYGIFYYKACIDLQDNFYVSFSFWETYDHHLYPRRVLVRSGSTGQWSELPD